MQAKKTYLRGKSVFIVSLIVIAITIITVYLTGEHYNRSITSNLYLSLAIIGFSLFIFMSYGLYKGLDLKDDFPEFKDFAKEPMLSHSADIPSFPNTVLSDSLEGLVLSFFLWIVMTLLFVVLLFVLEIVFWVSIFIILAMLYWVFFRALRLVFSKGKETKNKLGISLQYATGYTSLYLGWIFGIVYLVELLS